MVLTKNKDVLLIYPSYSFPRKSPPIGLAYLAAYIEMDGFDPYVVDFNISPMNDDVFSQLLRSKKWLMVGISFMTNQYADASRLSSTIKKILPSVPLIVGGPHPSSIPERTLKDLPAIDIVVKGEGEITLRDLAMALWSDNSIDAIPGICFRKNGTIISNSRRELITDLDALPFPGWKYFDVAKYNIFSLTGSKDSPVFALLSSRGCPNFCTFCDSHTIFSRKFNPRSAGNIFHEIMHLHNTYGMMEFDFVDDLVTVNKKRVLELCRLLSDSGIDFRWMANARVNTVDREMLNAMKNAGCTRVDFGVESGDPHVRKVIRKNITNDQISPHDCQRCWIIYRKFHYGWQSGRNPGISQNDGRTA
ncbi:MAG: radical SAM protein [Nitrospiraceae bacterium]|nr:MAG: radical SAM protein [Nitrospiraceae bacterium]